MASGSTGSPGIAGDVCVTIVSGSNIGVPGPAGLGLNKPMWDKILKKAVQTMRQGARHLVANATHDEHGHVISISGAKGVPNRPQTADIDAQHNTMVPVHNVKQHVPRQGPYTCTSPINLKTKTMMHHICVHRNAATHTHISGSLAETYS